MSALALVLDELAELVAAKVLAKLSAPSSHYTTRNGGTQPPGKSRAWALRNLRKVPGAKKVGRDWIVSVDAFDAWATEKDMTRVMKESRGPASNDTVSVAALVESSLVGSGFRKTRTSAR